MDGVDFFRIMGYCNGLIIVSITSTFAMVSVFENDLDIHSSYHFDGYISVEKLKSLQRQIQKQLNK